MADPTPYDILQDNQLSALQDIVTPYYQPPSEAEHSFPVVGQGVSADMYQQMSLAQGDGILITDDSEYSYRLEGMPGGAAETNSTNRMVLKVSQNTGRSEAILRGFYHVLYQDMQIELPPVTTTTTYIIALTYDPRREEEPAGPIRVEVHQNDLPRTHGRKHIVLRTVHREPNQLLTEATLGRGRQNISPTITVVTEADLPDPTDVLYGTIAVVRNRTRDGNVIPGTAQMFESRGIHGWHNLLQGPVENVYVHAGNNWNGAASCRWRNGGLDVTWNVNSSGQSGSSNVTMIQLPSKYGLLSSFRTVVFTTEGPRNFEFSQPHNVISGALQGTTSRPGWTRGNVFIPDTHITIN